MTIQITPFADAIAFQQRKVTLPTRTWRDIWANAHDNAFVVAGVMRDEMLADIQNAVIKAQDAGKTIKDFRTEFDNILSRRGWWTEKLADPKYKRWRTKVIYETNLRQSYNAGRLKQAKRLGRKYARYVAVG